MKIILTTAPRAESDLERGGLPFLGIGYIASYLKKNGYGVKIKDPHNFNWGVEKSIEEILKEEPDVVGVTSTTDNRFKAIKLIKGLKKQKPNLFIIAGGPHFALTAQDALEKIPELDCVIKAEGEVTTKGVLDEYQKNKDFSMVDGVFYRDKNNKIVETKDRLFEHYIDNFEMDWDLYEINKYNRNIDGTKIRAIGVISSRGCPNQCIFCVNATFRKNGGFRLRSPIKFVDEIEFLKNKYGFEGFDIWDDTLTISRDHVKQICEEIINRNLNIKWYARARVNTIDKEILSLMNKAGCIRISYGVESGSPKILKLIKKNILSEQAIKAAQLSSDAGMKVMMNFMVNLPHETKNDLKMTADLMNQLNKIKNVTAAYGFSIPYPGTEMETMARNNKILPDNFSWNKTYKNKKYKIAGTDPSLPLMEWPGAEIGEIKSFMAKATGVRRGLFKKGVKKIKKIKSFKEVKELAKTTWQYLRK